MTLNRRGWGKLAFLTASYWAELWCLQDAPKTGGLEGRPNPGPRLAHPKPTVKGQPKKALNDHSRERPLENDKQQVPLDAGSKQV